MLEHAMALLGCCETAMGVNGGGRKLKWVAQPYGERATTSKRRLVLSLPVSVRSAREGKE